jgi:hypothetical protein
MQDTAIFQVIFSFKNKAEMRAAQTGEDAFNDDARPAPINWIPYRNAIDESVIPKTPDNANKQKSFRLTFVSDFHIDDNESINKNTIGNRTVFARITPMNLRPIETTTVPTAYRMAAPSAITIPPNLALLNLSSILDEMPAIARTIAAAPIKYLRRKCSDRNTTARAIVKNG